MKKKVVLVMILTVFALTACAKTTQKDGEPEPQNEQNTETDLNIENSQKEDEELSKDNEKDEDETRENDQLGESEKETEVTVYRTDTVEEGVFAEKMKCSELTADNVWTLLKETGTVAENSKVLSFKQEGAKLTLEVNMAFGEQLRSYGTSGERALLQCVVNTYLDAFGAEEIKITEEGSTLNSGHAEYADYMTKMTAE